MIRRPFIAAAAAVVLLLAGRAAAADNAPQIEAWSLPRVSAMGQEIYRQDQAAWVATDAFRPLLEEAIASGVAGWIVVPDPEGVRVRFLLRKGDTLLPGWDVVVMDGKPGAVRDARGGVLTEEERSRFQARQTALANLAELRCAPTLNTVVADDPDSDDWLVWVLPAPTKVDAFPVGGHQRFRISADGRRVLRRDVLSRGCLDVEKGGPDENRVFTMTHVVSASPVETQVFVSLQASMPIYVLTRVGVWLVRGSEITRIEGP
jgi:hypothetical protein